MGTPLRVLIVEDSEDDAALLLRELRRGGYEPSFERVDTPAAMSAALAQQTWDIVISDHAMPHFSAPAALKLLQESGLEVPFIIVSGKIGEELAVAAMKAGAHDYIMKGNLTRLNAAIERELREAEVRRERRRAEEALRESEARCRTLVETSPDAIVLTNLDAKILMCNQQAAVLCGFESVAEVMGESAFEFIVPEDRQRVIDNVQRTLEVGIVRNIEYTLLKKDGTRLPAELSASFIANTEGKPKAFIGVVRDITERQKTWELTAERALLKETLTGSVRLLTEILSLVSPLAFSRASRIRRYVRHMAIQLHLPNMWQFELAAMLSQIGCITLPPDTLNRVYAGRPLSDKEQEMLASHPTVGCTLLAKIPGLESVARMIEGQQQPFRSRALTDDPKQEDTIALGAQMIKVALDFDQLVTRGASPKVALAEMRRRQDNYLPSLLAALDNVEVDKADREVDTADREVDKADREVRTVRAHELNASMILDDDIQTRKGLLLAVRGQKVTPLVLERLRSFARTVGVVEPFRVLVPRQIPQQETAGEGE